MCTMRPGLIRHTESCRQDIGHDEPSGGLSISPLGMSVVGNSRTKFHA